MQIFDTAMFADQHVQYVGYGSSRCGEKGAPKTYYLLAMPTMMIYNVE